MNTDVNKIEVNRVRVNMCTVNSFAARKAKGGTAMPVPIAKYMCYGKTNNDEDRDILQDLSGNGHDIQLYNFGFAEGSGYGKYLFDFSNWNFVSSEGEKTKSRIVLKKTSSSSDKRIRIARNVSYLTVGTKINFKTIVNGLSEGVELYFLNETSSDRPRIKLENGLNIIDTEVYDSGIYRNLFFITNDIVEEVNITIEQIPDYKGALVSDGVDDYGLCENFPILTKQNGYTVCALRKILKPFEEIQINACLLSNYNNSETGVFYIENRANDSWSTYSFGDITNYLDVDYNNDFVFQTSLSYNNYPINKGENTNLINRLYLFRLASWTSSHLPSAFYALEIYDRDLTDEEIAKVKARMIAEYEEKTGNKYEEEETI